MEKNRFELCDNWHFYLAESFPKKKAEEESRDAHGRCFYERDYEENENWKEVCVPHTFNDADLFAARIQDAGSGQKRTCALYRLFFTLPQGLEAERGRLILAFEGVRQACYVYVNGKLAGWSENGVAPFALDITPYADREGENLIAIAADNTASRNIPFCIAETPNHPLAEPGSFLFPQDEEVPVENRGVGFQWNCNDFNPSVGGLTRPVYLYVKPKVHLSLPYYSNLRTAGTYIYGSDYQIGADGCGFAKVNVEAETVNVSGKRAEVSLKVNLLDAAGNQVCSFASDSGTVCEASEPECAATIIPEEAYRRNPDGKGFLPVPEEAMPSTEWRSDRVTPVRAVSELLPLKLWSPDAPCLYRAEVILSVNGTETDREIITTGFRKAEYDKDRGVVINGRAVWLSGYAQRSSNEWPAIGIAPQWLKDYDMELVRESGANHIRWMHVAASPADVRSCDRKGVVITQPAGDKEAEAFGRAWAQRLELMRDVIIAFRNHPSILFWEAGNNSIGKEHMKQMRLLKEHLDPMGGRFMGCRTINTEEVLAESEYVGTMLNRHAARFLAEHGPITETEYSREEAPKRVWDDFTPPDYDYRNLFIGKGGKKQVGRDFYDLTMEELCLAETKGYAEFFFDRIGGASGKNWYSACAALCWTDSAQHGRQSYSENGRMSGRVDAARLKKQNFYLYQVLQSEKPMVRILGHWNYPADSEENYRYPLKRFNGSYFEETGELGRRDPRRKTVYVAGSYPIKTVELYVNGVKKGACSKPQDGFIFAFPDIDVTESGEIRAEGYAFGTENTHTAANRPDAEHRLVTAGKPVSLRLTLNTSPEGFRADGRDIAFADIQILDSEGHICPLCDARIDFTLEGEAAFLGGYTSGCFNLTGEEKREAESLAGAPPLSAHRGSVIHQPYVFAECGEARVFLRAGKSAGKLRLTAKADIPGVEAAVIGFESVIPDPEGGDTGLSGEQRKNGADRLSCSAREGRTAGSREDTAQVGFPAIPEADAVKYVPEDKCYCKILVNGQEPDTRGVRSVNENGAVWGAVLCILERMKSGDWKEDFEWNFDRASEKLTVTTADGKVLEAASHRTHLVVNGAENLMDGEPFLSPEGQLVMEVPAIVSWLPKTSCAYDERVNVLRIERRPAG